MHKTENFQIDVVHKNQNWIKDDYIISEKVLGSGAYGEVREVYHKKTKERWAVKIIYKEECSEEEKRSIMKEVAIMKEIDHPHIVKIFEFFESQRFIYIIMELLSGGELFDRIK